MTASDLRDLLIATLLRKVGGNKRDWRKAVGSVRVYDRATHPHCNWAINPAGDVGENAAIERVMDDLRSAHPLVEGG